MKDETINKENLSPNPISNVNIENTPFVSSLTEYTDGVFLFFQLNNQFIFQIF